MQHEHLGGSPVLTVTFWAKEPSSEEPFSSCLCKGDSQAPKMTQVGGVYSELISFYKAACFWLKSLRPAVKNFTSSSPSLLSSELLAQSVCQEPLRSPLSSSNPTNCFVPSLAVTFPRSLHLSSIPSWSAVSCASAQQYCGSALCFSYLHCLLTFVSPSQTPGFGDTDCISPMLFPKTVLVTEHSLVRNFFFPRKGFSV